MFLDRFSSSITMLRCPGACLHLQELQARRLPVVAIRPNGDKITRMSVRSQQQGTMHLSTFAPWLGNFETELLSFPNGRHDDQVDTVSQMLNWLHSYYRGPLTSSYGRF
jgi:predicted phage terminase large subunit-like protein